MNKVVLAFAVTALVTAAFSPLDAREFKHSGCAKAAEIKFPTDRFEQWAFAIAPSHPDHHGRMDMSNVRSGRSAVNASTM